jgi:hypothetical protein
MKRELNCNWCGTAVTKESKPHAGPNLCPDCHHLYETENHRPLHPSGERIIHHD